MLRKYTVVSFVLLCTASPASAQLSQTFDTLFDKILREDFQVSPGPHANHYVPAADIANQALTPALNSLITSNISSFPLSSTIAGVTFDFSTGRPVSLEEGQGPIFAESAETLGAQKLVVGVNATYLSLNRFRGMPLKDMRFTFTHEDLDDPGLGDNPTEIDVVDVFLGLDVNASIIAFSATYGLARNLDVGVAIPFISLNINGTARAVVQSMTLFIQDRFGGGARHFFDGDAHHPMLVNETGYDESASGLGDIAVRLKYRFPTQMDSDIATMLDVRIPTGSAADFLGTGSLSARLALIGSKRIGAFTPHVNFGYNYRGADLDSDEIEFAVGFDQKVLRGVTVAVDFLGEFDVNGSEVVTLYPGGGNTTTIQEQSPDTGAMASRTIELSNVPDRANDHTLNGSFGFWIAPSERFQVLANVLIPLQDGGLRSNIAPTLGMTLTL